MTGYKNLEAWKKSMLLVEVVYDLLKDFPREEMFGITSQLKRAAVSIPSNIAEGCGRNFKRDTKQFLYIARGSLYELDTILNIAVRVRILPSEKLEKLSDLIIENHKILNGLIRRYEDNELH
jgi:four helix bundle protein